MPLVAPEALASRSAGLARLQSRLDDASAAVRQERLRHLALGNLAGDADAIELGKLLRAEAFAKKQLEDFRGGE